MSSGSPAEVDAKCCNNTEDGRNQRSSMAFLQHQPCTSGRTSVCHRDRQRASEDQRSHRPVQRTWSHINEVWWDLTLALAGILSHLWSTISWERKCFFALPGTSHSPLCTSLFFQMFTSLASAHLRTHPFLSIGPSYPAVWLDALLLWPSVHAMVVLLIVLLSDQRSL